MDGDCLQINQIELTDCHHELQCKIDRKYGAKMNLFISC